METAKAEAKLTVVRTQANKSSKDLETAHRRIIALEFEVEEEQKKTAEVEQACQTARDRLEEALSNNEELCDASLKEKKELETRIA